MEKGECMSRSGPIARLRVGLSLASFLRAALALAAAMLVGCFATVKLIGDYDDVIDKGVTDLQQKAESYFVRLQSDPNTPYDQSVYDDLSVRLTTLKTRAAARPKYGIISQQIGILKSQFDTLQNLDKTSPRPLKPVVITSSESAIAVSVESILKLELAMKRGDTPQDSTAK
jgi:hypothetical protein